MYAHAHTHLHARTHACVHAHACTRTHTHTHKLLDVGLNISTSVNAELCFFSSVALFTWSMRQQVTQAVKFWHVHYTNLFELPCLHEVCSNSRSPKLSSSDMFMTPAIYAGKVNVGATAEPPRDTFLDMRPWVKVSEYWISLLVLCW